MGMNPGAAVGSPDLPLRFEVEQNFPNPFNPSTEIFYALAAKVQVELVVYDAAGRTVRTLVQEAQPAGRYGVRWDATDDSGHRVASGIYHYRLKAGSFEETRKMVLLK